VLHTHIPFIYQRRYVSFTFYSVSRQNILLNVAIKIILYHVTYFLTMDLILRYLYGQVPFETDNRHSLFLRFIEMARN
jgi:hypothetical protein